MAKLSRVFQNLFGRDGDQSHFGEFGSRVVGPGFTTKDPSVIQALSAFVTNGWLDAINGANKAPFLEDMNGLFYLLFYQICYGMQEGIPEWNGSTTYFTGSIVKKTGTTELYGSLTDNNTGNALPSQTSNAFWNYLNPATVAPGVISDFGGTTAPFGWYSCDGSVVSQAGDPGLFAAIGTNWNTGGEGAGNFRLPNLKGRTTIGAGTGSGLTPRTVGQQTIGEETHVLVPSETARLGHTHNISHTHVLPLAFNGNNPQFFIPPVGAWGPGQTTRSSTYWVQGIAGIAAAANLNFFNTDQPSTTDSGGPSYNGSDSNGGAHNNMQPSAVCLKIIKR